MSEVIPIMVAQPKSCTLFLKDPQSPQDFMLAYLVESLENRYLKFFMRWVATHTDCEALTNEIGQILMAGRPELRGAIMALIKAHQAEIRQRRHHEQIHEREALSVGQQMDQLEQQLINGVVPERTTVNPATTVFDNVDLETSHIANDLGENDEAEQTAATHRKNARAAVQRRGR